MKLVRLAGDIMVSAMGDVEGKGKGGFILLDKDFKVPELCPVEAIP